MLRKLVLIALFTALPVYGLATVVQPERCPDGDGSMHMLSHAEALATPCNQTAETFQTENDSHFCKDRVKCQSRVWSEPTVQILLQSVPFTSNRLDNYRHPIVPRRVLNAVWRPPRSV